MWETAIFSPLKNLCGLFVNDYTKVDNIIKWIDILYTERSGGQNEGEQMARHCFQVQLQRLVVQEGHQERFWGCHRLDTIHSFIHSFCQPLWNFHSVPNPCVGSRDSVINNNENNKSRQKFLPHWSFHCYKPNTLSLK